MVGLLIALLAWSVGGGGLSSISLIGEGEGGGVTFVGRPIVFHLMILGSSLHIWHEGLQGEAGRIGYDMIRRGRYDIMGWV